MLFQPAHPLLATLSSHPLSTRRGSNISIFTFRPRINSEADFADDETSVAGEGRSRLGSTVTPYRKRRTGSVRSHCSQVFTPTLIVNGRLNLSLDQNGITGIGPHTPTSLPGCSMEKVKENMVSTSRRPWKCIVIVSSGRASMENVQRLIPLVVKSGNKFRLAVQIESYSYYSAVLTGLKMCFTEKTKPQV